MSRRFVFYVQNDVEVKYYRDSITDEEVQEAYKRWLKKKARVGWYELEEDNEDDE